MIEKKNIMERYNLPREVKFCIKCTISNQRPRITFDEHGICSACNFAEFKQKKIDWTQREIELMETLDRFRKNDGGYDVLVPCSGGKDAAYIAHDQMPMDIDRKPGEPSLLDFTKKAIALKL